MNNFQFNRSLKIKSNSGVLLRSFFLAIQNSEFGSRINDIGFQRLRIALVIIVLILYAKSIHSQNTFENYYDLGGNYTEFGYCVAPTSDGGFVVAGRQGININTVNLLLMKIDSGGQTLWYKSIGSANTQTWAYSVTETSDSGFVSTGLHSDLSGSYSIYVIRTNAIGDTIWTKKYSITNQNAMTGVDIIEAPDSGFVLLCDYVNDIDTTWALQLLRINNNGDTMWTKHIMQNSGVISGGISQTSDGGYILAGTINPSGNDNSILLVKTNGLLDTTWCKEISNPSGVSYILNRTRCVQQTNDGGYFVCGTAWDMNNSTTGILIIKTDNLGDTVWTRVISPSGTDSGSGGGFQTSDSGFVVAGGTGATGNGDALLLKTNSLGIPQWNSTFGGANNDLANSIVSTIDGGFLLCGTETSWGDGSGIYIVRTDSVGYAPTGVNPLAPKIDRLSVYPNPNDGEFTIEYVVQEKGILQLLNIYGIPVAQYEIPEYANSITIQKDHPAGLYFCRLIVGGALVGCEKIIVK